MKHDGMSNFPLLSKCFCPFLQFKYQGMLSSQQIYVGIPSIVLNSLLKFCRFTKSLLVFITPTFAKWILDIKPPPATCLLMNSCRETRDAFPIFLAGRRIKAWFGTWGLAIGKLSQHCCHNFCQQKITTLQMWQYNPTKSRDALGRFWICPVWNLPALTYMKYFLGRSNSTRKSKGGVGR